MLLRLVASISLVAWMAAPAHAQVPSLQSFGPVGAAPAAPWKVSGLPEQTKPFTQFSVVDVDGKRALKVETNESYGNLVHALGFTGTSAKLTWQWRVEKLVEGADLRQKAGDDTTLKVCVFYDLSIDKISFGERQILRYARSKSADTVPAATVCYVWDTQLPVGTTIENAFTKRMRYIVLRSGGQRMNQWVTEKRDVMADFLKLFGSESDTVPPIIGVAVGADSDNTHTRSVGYVTGLALEP